MTAKMLLMVALGGGARGCGRDREMPPSTVSGSAILADTAKPDVVDLEDVCPGW